ncbi:MAG: hypothetical protein ACLU95_13345 [Bacteroides stercoris]
MIDERAYELLCCQLGLANEEKAGLRKQVNELIARLKALEESNKENSKALVDTINELSVTVENYRKEMEFMRKQLEAKDEVNRMLANEISNLRLQLEDSRKHRFGRTSEQRKLLNNRNLDKSALHESEYDGSDKRTMITVRLTVTKPAAVPLLTACLHRTANLQGERKPHRVPGRPN